MQPPPPRGPGLGLLLAFLAGAIGGAAGALLVMPRGTPGGAEDPGLRQAVAALDDTVRALGEQVTGLSRAQPARASSPTEPLAVHDGGAITAVDVAALLARLDDIARHLQARSTGGGPGFTGAASQPPLDIARSSPNRTALLALSVEENDETRPLWRRHAFWTCQQVIDAYGLPDQIETGDSAMGWYYQTGERTVHFVFYEGMLINIWN
jgi:hypothetical protein